MVHGSREKTKNLDLLQVILKRERAVIGENGHIRLLKKKKPTLLKPKATRTEIQLAVLSGPRMKCDMSLKKRKDVLD